MHTREGLIKERESVNSYLDSESQDVIFLAVLQRFLNIYSTDDAIDTLDSFQTGNARDEGVRKILEYFRIHSNYIDAIELSQKYQSRPERDKMLYDWIVDKITSGQRDKLMLLSESISDKELMSKAIDMSRNPDEFLGSLENAPHPKVESHLNPHSRVDNEELNRRNKKIQINRARLLARKGEMRESLQILLDYFHKNSLKYAKFRLEFYLERLAYCTTTKDLNTLRSLYSTSVSPANDNYNFFYKKVDEKIVKIVISKLLSQNESNYVEIKSRIYPEYYNYIILAVRAYPNIIIGNERVTTTIFYLGEFDGEHEYVNIDESADGRVSLNVPEVDRLQKYLEDRFFNYLKINKRVLNIISDSVLECTDTPNLLTKQPEINTVGPNTNQKFVTSKPIIFDTPLSPTMLAASIVGTMDESKMNPEPTTSSRSIFEKRHIHMNPKGNLLGGVFCGIRILDFVQSETTLTATGFFSDRGAEVIHIDTGLRRELLDDNNYKEIVGKRMGFELDIKTEVSALYELIEKSDILLENISGHGSGNALLDADLLLKLNPKLIHISMTSNTTSHELSMTVMALLYKRTRNGKGSFFKMTH